MTKLVTEIDIPFIQAHLLPVETDNPHETRKTQVNELIELSKHSWIVRSVIGYYVMHYEDVSAILKDKRWHSGLHVLQSLRKDADKEVLAKTSNNLTAMEGEEHAFIRHIAAPAFSAALAETQRMFSYKVAKQLLGEMVDNSHNEFVNNFCKKYPMLILCHTIGLPEEDWEKFTHWSNIMSSPVRENKAVRIEDLMEAEREFYLHISKIISDRKQNPKDDFITKLVNTEYHGKFLSYKQIAFIVGTMISGGMETFIDHIGLCLVYLCDNTNVYAKIKENPDSIADAALEITRLTSSIRGTLRIASEDIEYKDVLFPKGTFVFTSLASANRDKSRYENPDDFQLGRQHGGDMSFGGGVHYCMGAHLAKVELTEAIRAIVDTFDTISLKDVVYKPSNSGIFGPESLNINYTLSGM